MALAVDAVALLMAHFCYRYPELTDAPLLISSHTGSLASCRSLNRAAAACSLPRNEFLESTTWLLQREGDHPLAMMRTFPKRRGRDRRTHLFRRSLSLTIGSAGSALTTTEQQEQLQIPRSLPGLRQQEHTVYESQWRGQGHVFRLLRVCIRPRASRHERQDTPCRSINGEANREFVMQSISKMQERMGTL